MAGSTAQEKAVAETLNSTKDFRKQIRDGEYNISNRFDNYNDPFNYDAVSNQLDTIFGETEKKINRNTADQIATEQGNAVSRFASRGVTGGSVIEDNANNIATNMNTGKINALAELGVGKASSMADLMKYFNNLDFRKTGMAQNVDAQNMGNILSALASSYGTSMAGANALSGTNWMDDVYAGLDVAQKGLNAWNKYEEGNG